jgi:hypothetical protein
MPLSRLRRAGNLQWTARSHCGFLFFLSRREFKHTVACPRRAVKHKAGLRSCPGLQARGENLQRGEMQLELVSYVLVRLSGLYLIMELLILALNPIPDTAEKWKVKKQNMLRRLCYYVALNLAVIWILTI